MRYCFFPSANFSPMNFYDFYVYAEKSCGSVVTRPSVTANKLRRYGDRCIALANGIWIIRRGGESTSNRFIADWFANSALRRGPERSTALVINGRGCAVVVQKLSAEKTDRTSRCGSDFRSASPPGCQ